MLKALEQTFYRGRRAGSSVILLRSEEEKLRNFTLEGEKNKEKRREVGERGTCETPKHTRPTTPPLLLLPTPPHLPLFSPVSYPLIFAISVAVSYTHFTNKEKMYPAGGFLAHVEEPTGQGLWGLPWKTDPLRRTDMKEC